MQPSSFPPTLVIGDLHHRIRQVNTLLRQCPADVRRVIFLGDYFDRFGDTPEEAAKVARWLARSLRRDDRVHLLGNHDLPYLFPDHPQARCAGWSAEKHAAIAAALRGAPVHRLQLACRVGDILLTHAGVSALWAGSHTTLDELLVRAERALDDLATRRPNPWFAAGWSRGGRAEAGGPLWCDFHHELVPIRGLYQICGHTPRHDTTRARCVLADGTHVSSELVGADGWRPFVAPQEFEAASSIDLCLDNGLTAAAVLRPAALAQFPEAYLCGHDAGSSLLSQPLAAPCDPRSRTARSKS